jgi:hypothetical protein
MTSNGGGLRISKKCRLPGYKFWVWFCKKAITNIICLKNLMKIYRARLLIPAVILRNPVKNCFG